MKKVLVVNFNSHFISWMLLIMSFTMTKCNGSENEIGPVNLAIIEQKLDISQLDNALTLIRNVTLISNVLEDGQSGMDILIRDGLIEKVQVTGTITGEVDNVIDGTGKYLIPGLADMHTHPVTTGHIARNDLFLFLAHGVTTIRVMWGFDGHISLRDSIQRGEMLGPNMHVASAGFVGSQPLWAGSVQTANSAKVRELVRDYDNAGYDFIKVYSGLPLDQYTALMDEAKMVGIVPIGHLPSSVPLSVAIESSQRSIEHIGAVNGNEQSFTEIANSAIENDVWFCPTLTVANRSKNNISQYQSDPIYKALSNPFKTWLKNPASQPVLNDVTSFLNSRIDLLQALNDQNGPIISGTDMGIRYILPGKSLHEELEFYVQAGMSPSEALATSTINAHNFLNQPQGGIVIEGNVADLVLLHANPKEDITNLKKIAGVMKSGYYFSENDIAEILKALGALN